MHYWRLVTIILTSRHAHIYIRCIHTNVHTHTHTHTHTHSAELSNLKEDLSIRASEYDRLVAQVKTLRDELHESKLQLAKLHLLESLQQEVVHLKEQLEEALRRSESLSRDLKASELKVLAVEGELPDSQHKCKKMAAELEVVEREKDLLEQQVIGLKKDLAELKARYEDQVSYTI